MLIAFVTDCIVENIDAVSTWEEGVYGKTCGYPLCAGVLIASQCETKLV